jgi:hypothetical protein
MQKQKIRIIVAPTNAIFEGGTGYTNSQMTKPGVDHQQNSAV